MGNMSKFNKDFKSELHFKFFGGLDEIVDEKGSMYIALRKTAWYNEGKEPSEDNAKIEIRKWQVQDGESQADMPRRGVTFLTEEGPHNLTEAMVKHGFGDTKKIINQLKTRDDFPDAVQHMYDDDESMNSDEFFDAREMLLMEA